MTKKNRGLQVSIVAGLIAIALVLAALILHVVNSDTAMATSETVQTVGNVTNTTEAQTTRDTMIMPDGSVMYMDNMPSASQGSTTPATAAAGTDSMQGMDMGGSIDWQVILMILALVAAAVAFGTAVNAYLRRQLDNGALAQPETGCE
jgi:hypothetical protein